MPRPALCRRKAGGGVGKREPPRHGSADAAAHGPVVRVAEVRVDDAACAARSAGSAGRAPRRKVVRGRQPSGCAPCTACALQRGIRRRADADRGVKAFVHQGHDPVGELNVQPDVRVMPREVGQKRRKARGAEAERCRQTDPAPGRDGGVRAPRSPDRQAPRSGRAAGRHRPGPLRSAIGRGSYGSAGARQDRPPAGRQASTPGWSRCPSGRRRWRSCRSPPP